MATPLSDRIAEASFVPHVLSGVAASGHWLPVRPIPEQAHVALMSDLVIDHVGGATTATGTQAIDGQRQEGFRFPVPILGVAALMC